MEAVMLFLISMVGLVVLSGASLRWHPDTREQWPGDAPATANQAINPQISRSADTVNHFAYAMLALDIARERSREAEQNWLAASLVAAGPARRSTVRRAAATVLAVISRSAATAVRRLDSRVDEDLRRTLATAE